MSAGDALLIFLDRHNEFEGWLHLRDGRVAGRGTALERLPPLVDGDTQAAVRTVAVVPGEAVTLHWLELPDGLAPAQATAAARLMASEVSAQPLIDMHVAVGGEVEGSTTRPVALVPALAMAGWLGRLQSQGLDPDLIVPEPLLLLPPAQGFYRYDRGEVPLYRGPADAFSIEPELAELVVADAPVTPVEHEDFEAGLGAALARPPVNLRQGDFAKRRRWKIEWKLVRRLALLALATLVVTLAIQLAAIMRYTFAADAIEREANQVAVGAVPGVERSADPRALLDQRVTDLRGSGAGYSALASAVFSAVQATPNAELTAITFDRDGALRATVQGDSPATIAALAQGVTASGFAAETGPMRSGGGRPTAELTVRAR